MVSTSPQITSVTPSIGVAGGEVAIQCRGFKPGLPSSAQVLLGQTAAAIVSASEERVIVRLPENAQAPGITLRVADRISDVHPFALATRLATGLHPVTSPVIAPDKTVITTISGSRGQQIAQPLIRLDCQGAKVAFPCEILNPTGLAFGPDAQLYVSSRAEGIVYRYRDLEHLEVFAEDLGVPCGIAFDSHGFLYVGDRSGKIHRLDPSGNKEEFASLEPSVSAYHLAVDAADRLYVTGPTLATRDALYRISPDRSVEVVLKGLARPQGMAMWSDGDLLLSTSYQGKKGVFRFSPESGTLEHYVAGPTLVGVAVSAHEIFLADNSSIYWIAGL